MSGFSGYNQIIMNPYDVAKTAFKSPLGLFDYTFMLFGLKNAETTYQRVMTTIFHIMHDCLEHYDDDIVLKSKEIHDHTDN